MDLIKTETHPFDGIGDTSVFQTKLDLRGETLKKCLLALRRKAKYLQTGLNTSLLLKLSNVWTATM